MSGAISRTALNAYRNVGIESIVGSATPHQLVVMLFAGARAAVASAHAHMDRGNIAAKCEAISKAIAIIDGGLKASLDLSVGGQLAQNLSDLYVYMTQRLLQANASNDRGALHEVAQLLQQLGGAWESLATRSVETKAAAAPKPPRVATSYGSV